MNIATMTSAVGGNVAEFLRRRLGLMNEHELCALLGVERRTLHEWRSKGRGPASISVGNTILMRETDVSAWLNHHVRQTPETTYSTRKN